MAQTLVDSHGPLVVATAGGSLLMLAATISTPGVSQLSAALRSTRWGGARRSLPQQWRPPCSALAPAALERIGAAIYRSAGDATVNDGLVDDVVDDDDAGPDGIA